MNALQRAAAVFAALFLTLASPGGAAPGDGTPKGVSGGMVFDAKTSSGPYLTFVLKLHWHEDATFFVRTRDSNGRVSEPIPYGSAQGSAAELPVQIKVSPPTKAVEAWIEWEYVFIGPNIVDGPTVPPNSTWMHGNRAYGADNGTFPKFVPTPTPTPKSTATSSDLTVASVVFTPHNPCLGWMHLDAHVSIGANGAGGWLVSVYDDGTIGKMHEIRVKPSSPQELIVFEDMPLPALKRGTQPVTPTTVGVRYRFYDMGPWYGKPSDHLFPPPATGPWKMFGPWTGSYNPYFIAKPCPSK